jgi:hypothetical protein
MQKIEKQYLIERLPADYRSDIEKTREELNG